MPLQYCCCSLFSSLSIIKHIKLNRFGKDNAILNLNKIFCVYLYYFKKEKTGEKIFARGNYGRSRACQGGGGGVSIYLPPSALFLAGGVVIRFGQEMPARGRLCAKSR